MKRTLVLMLVLALIPMFMGIFCPCATAAPAAEVSIAKTPCHGCCSEVKPVPSQPADFFTFFFQNPVFSKIYNTLKALSLDAGQDTAINRRAIAPAGAEPLFEFSPQPLYLTLQVFRI